MFFFTKNAYFLRHVQ